MDPYYKLYFDTIEEANQALKYMETCIENRGRISKYELDLGTVGAAQASILEMDQGWTTTETATIVKWQEPNGEMKWTLMLPRPRKWFH